MITLGTLLSAMWIISANGFMQHPTGAYWDGDKIILTSFAKLFFNPYTWYMYVHNHLSAILLAGFVVLAISSWQLLKGKEEDKHLFIISAKYGTWAILISGILLPIVGNSYLDYLNVVQPDKIAMIIGTTSGGLKTVVRISFGAMVSLGTVFIVISAYTLIFFKKFTISKTLQNIYIWLVPLPYLAIIFGWMVTEFGRQPWIIYKIMRVSEGISIVPVEQIWFSLISIVVLYAILFVMDYVLTISRIKKGIVEPKEITGGEENE